MSRTFAKVLRGMVAAGGIALASGSASAFDLFTANQNFDAQFEIWAQQQMMGMLQQCNAARANGTLTGSCFGNYDPRILSDRNMGGEIITEGWNGRQGVQDNALQRWGDAFNGQQQFQGADGTAVWGQQGFDTQWLNLMGELWQMNGYAPPDLLNWWQQMFPMQ